jgi:hypothetical protein
LAVAPTGHGELTYRHGEALMRGAALVCQDLGHVEMMFLFRDRENVAFCRPDSPTCARPSRSWCETRT